MGASEEAGKVATGVVEGLKSSPLALTLIVLNVILFGLVYLGTKDTRDHYEKIIGQMLDTQAKAQELLARCAGVPAKTKSPMFMPPTAIPIQVPK